jgi:hypothetical protein
MRLNIFHLLMKQRKVIFDIGVDDLEGIKSEIERLFDEEKSFENITLLSSILNHYREVVFFKETPVWHDGLLEIARVMMGEVLYDGNTPDFIKETVAYSMGLTHMPFIRGGNQKVYEYLIEHDSFDAYFDNCRRAFNYFNMFPSFLSAELESECYKVWKRYASDKHGSDLIFHLFLSGEIPFKELAELNSTYLKEIEGLGHEWQTQ